MSNFVPGRRGYEYFTQSDFRGGINHEEENATPGQVLEARNVWSPLGRPETRPGYFGVNQFNRTLLVPDNQAAVNATVALASEVVATSTFVVAPPGTSLPVGGLVAQSPAALGDSYYIGFESLTEVATLLNPVIPDTLEIGAVTLNIAPLNAAAIQTKPQYFNGTDFVNFPSVIEIANPDDPTVVRFPATAPTLTNALTTWTFVNPADWEQSILTDGINTETKYWIKFTLFSTGGAAITAGTTIVNTVGTPANVTLVNGGVRGAIAAQMSSGRLYVTTRVGYSSTVPGTNVERVFYTKSSDIKSNNQDIYYDALAASTTREPSSFAVIQQFNVVYVANDYNMTEFRLTAQNDFTSIQARVEDNPDIIGPGKLYSPLTLRQSGTFPRAKFIMWYRNLLWFANIEGEEFKVRWSASTYNTGSGLQEGYRVFPTGSTFENIEDDDNSPITAMSSLNEHALIFKNNSIWRMVYAGVGESETATFSAVKVENGVGCISNASIGKTPLGLMFLAEDGVYLFDGNRTSKMTVAIDDTMHSVNFSAAHLASGVTWRDNNVYFLSIPTDGAGLNNTVIAFDYKYMMRSNEGGVAPAVWIFDNVPAQSWMLDEAESDLEVLYFFDQNGAQYQVDYSRTDNGAATLSFVQTLRQGFGDWITKDAREVRINATNAVEDLQFELVGDDRNYGTDGSISYHDFAETPADGAVFDVDPFSREARRERRVATRENGEWFTTKVSDNEKGRRMQLHRISVGYVRKGPR